MHPPPYASGAHSNSAFKKYPCDIPGEFKYTKIYELSLKPLDRFCKVVFVKYSILLALVMQKEVFSGNDTSRRMPDMNIQSVTQIPIKSCDILPLNKLRQNH